MRKTRIAISFIIAMLFVLVSAFPAMADATRVVTIGQDLTDEQEAFIINYFGVDLSTAQVIYVNNQQEREYVGSWIPLEQIGNMTISSAYVQPTNSGGIQVKTANLTYVTGNMIASVLSTAGVKNCNVVAAAPFPVSGTGALTGVMIAYQQATGEPLDETKRDLAVQEFTVTQQAAETLGENEALQLVNAVKMEVIQSEVSAENTAQIEEIVDQVIANVEQKMLIDNRVDNSVTNEDNRVYEDNRSYDDNRVYIDDDSVTNIDQSYTYINNGLSDSDRQLIIDLATEIARQEYNYDDVKDTLKRVEENLSNETNISIVIDNSDETNVDNSNETNVNNSNEVNADNDVQVDVDQEAVQEEDSILSNTNDDLIDAVYQSSTREEDIAAIEEAIQEEQPAEAPAASSLYDMGDVEVYYENPAAVPAEPVYEENPMITIEPVYEENPMIQTPDVAQPVYEYEPDQPVMNESEYVWQDPAAVGPVNEYEPDQPVIEPVYEYEPDQPVIEPVYEYEPDQPVMNESEYVWQDPAVVEPSYEENPAYVPEEPVVVEPVYNPEEPVYVEDPANVPEEPVVEPVYEYEPEEPIFEEPAMLLGGWTIQAGKIEYELPEDVKSAFDSATEFYFGMDFTPVAYLGSQVVAGMNYRILCTGTPVVLDPQEGLYVITIYKDLEGNASITDVKELSLAELEETAEENIPETGLAGGWYAPEEYEAAELPEDAKTAFDAATAMLMGVNYVPADLLGTKVIAGTEYAILCHATMVTAEPQSYFAVMFIAANVDGSTQILKIVPLDLAELNEDMILE